MVVLPYTVAFLLLSSLQTVKIANSQSFIGINYGQVADNLPPAPSTAKLLQSTSIQKVRLYGPDPAIIKALANTGIGIVIGTANGDIPGLASDPNFAKSWINTNVLPFYPASNIILITVGNEVMTSNDQNLVNKLLPAMQNVQNALNDASLGGKIKVSTVHSMGVLKQSEPPSSGSFDPSYGDQMKGLLEFNSANGSPFAINPYPYYAYRSDTRPETLAFCLFQPNAGRMDGNTKIKYMNMFDAQVDAVYSALNSMGFKNVEIVVAETGWPFKEDDNDVGPSIENAKAYNGNLIAHLRSMVGTPLMPGKSVDTYLFALYDEDLKPGPGSERSFGLFKTDLTMVYDVGLSTSSQLLFCFLTFSFSVFPSPWFLVWLLESSSWGCCYCSSPGVAAAALLEEGAATSVAAGRRWRKEDCYAVEREIRKAVSVLGGKWSGSKMAALVWLCKRGGLSLVAGC
ncbi:glucan endo-1,3-beta-glucosidase 7-like [Populus nigra]|uniref:glucan endo-1,3-beta-glucosidase 7-like n=1 Tax=Populus nigra TaxID=3691 RepID=UPI002B2693B5|nr:glucan endo-1,3-beta-glucosidase 7-like [Populus nigra]